MVSQFSLVTSLSSDDGPFTPMLGVNGSGRSSGSLAGLADARTRIRVHARTLACTRVRARSVLFRLFVRDDHQVTTKEPLLIPKFALGINIPPMTTPSNLGQERLRCLSHRRACSFEIAYVVLFVLFLRLMYH